MHYNALAHLRRVHRTVRVLRDQKLRPFADIRFLRSSIRLYRRIPKFTRSK